MSTQPIDQAIAELDPRSAPLFNVARYRRDLWTKLRDMARRVRRVAEAGGDVAPVVANVRAIFDYLAPLEAYHAFPGPRALRELRAKLDRKAYAAFAAHTVRVARLLSNGGYRRLDIGRARPWDYSDLVNVGELRESIHADAGRDAKPYFELLTVDELTPAEAADYRRKLLQLRSNNDAFVYDVVTVTTFEDALMAVLANADIQAVAIRYTFPFKSTSRHAYLNDAYTFLHEDPGKLEQRWASDRSLELARLIRRLRPELDLYLVTDTPVEHLVGNPSRYFKRVFYHEESHYDFHGTLLKDVYARYETPFFFALKRYSQRPTGVFHALPISRGNSILKSHWIQELGQFYGHTMLQAETSATTGGLDSLLQPHGSLKQAQTMAARAFGSRHSYFVTNGTSTANKIVLQALMRPGDIVLLSHDCHKSHHYAVILAGARPVYLDGYPLTQYTMYGGVDLSSIKGHLLALKRAGKLDRVKMLLLTNMTFDGITYDPVRVMEEVLAIKPDMVFVWDEAWFAFARFNPVLRGRTAMDAAQRLLTRYASPEYREEYRRWAAEMPSVDDAPDAWAKRRLLPDPDRVRVRVYATHSTHKTLTSFRQGSMIHVHDQDFEHGVRSVFNEAYMTHTSTSPNYQILASLDVGRRQVELEGYDLVRHSIELAMMLRERIRADQLLARYFRVLGPEEMVPKAFRPSGLERYYSPDAGWSHLEEAWGQDEFVLDPTRITLDVGRTGMDGDTFKQLLMDRFDIQINKTSRNTVLFMIHIGMSRGTVANLVKVLTRIATELNDRLAYQGDADRALFKRQVSRLTENLPPLPNFSHFHEAFRTRSETPTPEGDARDAFFLSYDESACDYVPLDRQLLADVEAGREVVSAGFVTPYPPGFPVLMAGQVVSAQILRYLLELDVKEIHGFEPDYGLRVFKPSVLADLVEETAELRAASRKEGITS